MAEYYSVVYNSDNLYAYQMNINEVLIVEEFRNELIKCCDELNIARARCWDGSTYTGRLKDNSDFYIKFKEDIGYFVLNGERGIFELKKGFPTTSKNIAKRLILEDEFFTGGCQFELKHRNQLEKKWKNQYSIAYDCRKAIFEYTIENYYAVFKDIPDDLIKKYTNYLNNTKLHWNFNKDDLVFKVIR